MRYNKPIYRRDFRLGSFYSWQGVILQFIKVTPKGFNLLNHETNCCVLKKHLYSFEWRNKQIPANIKYVRKVTVPDYVQLTEVAEVSV